MYGQNFREGQMAHLNTAQINGIPTNVNVELGQSATAADVVRVVVKD
jgi:hypothetical protein